MTNKIWMIIENIIVFFLTKLFKLCGKELSKKTTHGIMQFFKFGVVGVSNTIISYIIYAASLLVLRKFEILQSTNYIVAQVIAFVLSVLWSFYWNNRLVFTIGEGEQRSIWKALLKTYVSYSFTGLFLNTILLVLWVHILGVSEFIAPILNLLISVPLNYVINKYWAFKTNR